LPPTLSPLAADRYLLKVTIGGETHAKLRHAQDLIGPAHAAGDLAPLLDRALTLLVEHLERTRLKKTDRPSRRPRVTGPTASHAGSRHVPAALKRAVWARDGRRCAFEGAHGRCTETSRLELHHLIPFATGGPTTLENLALRCRAHNRYESELRFGPWTTADRAASPDRGPGAVCAADGS
jgi:5-methylcytosine-specific restriction endonuclease McrA